MFQWNLEFLEADTIHHLVKVTVLEQLALFLGSVPKCGLIFIADHDLDVLIKDLIVFPDHTHLKLGTSIRVKYHGGALFNHVIGVYLIFFKQFAEVGV